MTHHTFLFTLVFALYAASGIAFFIFFITQKEVAGQSGFLVAIAGFLVQSVLIVYRAISVRQFPVSNLYESLAFFAWVIVLVYIIAEWRKRIWADAVFVLPLVLSLFAYAAALDKGVHPLPPALQSPWLAVHVTLCFISYACFALSFAFAIMYLWQERELKTKKIDAFFFRLPPLGFLDRLGYRSIAFGFIFLSLGIISGSLWAQRAWGRFWNWDPKETWSLIMWLVYLVYLHGRLASGWKGRKSAFLALIGFLVMLFTYLGVSFLLPGLHSYLN